MFKGKDGNIHFETNDKVTLDIIKDCDIEQIYSGKDNYCRCGCGGKYYDFDHSNPIIKRLLTKAEKFLHKHIDTVVLYSGEKDGWINIPTTFNGPGTCICIYFKGTPKLN